MPGNGIRQLHGKTGSSISFPWENKECLRNSSGKGQGLRCLRDPARSCQNPGNSGLVWEKGEREGQGLGSTLVLRKWGSKSTSSSKSSSKTFLGFLRRDSLSEPVSAAGGEAGREGEEGKEKEKEREKEKRRKGKGKEGAVTASGQDKHRQLVPTRSLCSRQRDFPPFPGKAAGAGLGSVVQRNPWEQEL